MDARKYIKKHGFKKAMAKVESDKKRRRLPKPHEFELQKLVHSHYMVTLCGGIESTRALAISNNDSAFLKFIEDVESCQ